MSSKKKSEVSPKTVAEPKAPQVINENTSLFPKESGFKSVEYLEIPDFIDEHCVQPFNEKQYADDTNQFVRANQSSPTETRSYLHRKAMAENFYDFISTIESAPLQTQLWIGGSFLRHKKYPDDIDVVLICDTKNFDPYQFGEWIASVKKTNLFYLLAMESKNNHDGQSRSSEWHKKIRDRYSCDMHVITLDDADAVGYWANTLGHNHQGEAQVILDVAFNSKVNIENVENDKNGKSIFGVMRAPLKKVRKVPMKTKDIIAINKELKQLDRLMDQTKQHVDFGNNIILQMQYESFRVRKENVRDQKQELSQEKENNLVSLRLQGEGMRGSLPAHKGLGLYEKFVNMLFGVADYCLRGKNYTPSKHSKILETRFPLEFIGLSRGSTVLEFDMTQNNPDIFDEVIPGKHTRHFVAQRCVDIMSIKTEFEAIEMVENYGTSSIQHVVNCLEEINSCKLIPTFTFPTSKQTIQTINLTQSAMNTLRSTYRDIIQKTDKDIIEIVGTLGGVMANNLSIEIHPVTYPKTLVFERNKGITGKAPVYVLQEIQKHPKNPLDQNKSLFLFSVQRQWLKSVNKLQKTIVPKVSYMIINAKPVESLDYPIGSKELLETIQELRMSENDPWNKQIDESDAISADDFFASFANQSDKNEQD
jgi:hypothetical protein